jgi:hypothetical protein
MIMDGSLVLFVALGCPCMFLDQVEHPYNTDLVKSPEMLSATYLRVATKS